MCEFCVKHGEGRKWYLEAKNYSEDLLNDLSRRKTISDIVHRIEESGKKFEERFNRLEKAPGLVQRLVRWLVVRKMKKEHYGQVVPIEDVERIFNLINSVVRVACVCRYTKLGEEKRYCYGISMGPIDDETVESLLGGENSFLNGPESKGAEEMDKDEALSNLRDYERQGLCHTVWTFGTPFIGAICNCDRSDCLAMRSTVTHDVPVMFRAEYVAEVRPDLCEGCRQCMRVCQFGAIGYSAAQGKIFIDPRRCYGCGICRAVCPRGAIELKDRVSVPAAAERW